MTRVKVSNLVLDGHGSFLGMKQASIASFLILWYSSTDYFFNALDPSFSGKKALFLSEYYILRKTSRTSKTCLKREKSLKYSIQDISARYG